MSDYISRADAIEMAVDVETPQGTYERAIYVDDLMALPSANAVHKPDYSYEADMVKRLRQADAVQGEWIEVEDYNGDVHYKCDQCGEEWTFPFGTPKENNANFCPNCGARMKGGAE